jgi:hypothetical protein
MLNHYTKLTNKFLNLNKQISTIQKSPKNINLDSNEYFSSKRITDAYYKSESNSVKLNLNLNKKKEKVLACPRKRRKTILTSNQNFKYSEILESVPNRNLIENVEKDKPNENLFGRTFQVRIKFESFTE